MVSIIAVLIISNAAVWSSVYAGRKTDALSVYFLDVGQGDAILIDSPDRNRVLIDGGPDRKVLSELGKILPFGDRRIDVVIATHPDADHITGLVEVVRRFDVGVFVETGVQSDSGLDDILDAEVSRHEIPGILARRGINIDLGGGAELLVVYPDQDVSNWETNEASVVAKLTYGSRSFLLTGDSPKNSEYKLMAIDGGFLEADVLKVGHHGSDTSTSPLFAQTVTPEYAVVSAGRDNRYGHPHESVLGVLRGVGAQMVSTAESGTVGFETDGIVLKLK